MSMHDPISDMLIRIRNAQRANKVIVAMSSSKLKCAIAKALEEEGYIRDFSVSVDVKPVLEIQLKYYAGCPVIEQIKRVLRPGLRIHKVSSEVPNVMNGLGIVITNISEGVTTGCKARFEGVGGELLCIVA